MKLFFSLNKASMFKFAGIFLIILSLVSCSKEELASEIDFQRHLVAGTGNFQNTFKIWQLDSMSVNGKDSSLTTNQKKYTKKFYHSGAYIDSDGFSGTWEIPEINTLNHFTTGSRATTKLTSNYEIVEVNSAQLHLKSLNTAIKYEFFFIIIN